MSQCKDGVCSLESLMHEEAFVQTSNENGNVLVENKQAKKEVETSEDGFIKVPTTK